MFGLRSVHTQPPTGQSPLFGRQFKVLVADDSESNRELMADVIGLLETPEDTFEVTTAASRPDAERILQQQEFDVLVTDNSMPNADDGLTLVRSLQQREHRPLTVMCSGDTDPKLAEQAKAAGAFAFFTKPFDVKALLDTIREGLKQKAAS